MTYLETYRVYDRIVESAGHARGFVARILTERNAPEAVFAGELIVTELVANAVKHTEGSQIIVMVWPSVPVGVGTRIGVFDHSRVKPMLCAAGPDAESGRGLALVEAVAKDWGIELTARGKWVWAELP